MTESDQACCVHIFGASGSGTTTLGAALAEQLSARHLDTDTYYWRQTNPPFQQKRPPRERLLLLRNDMQDYPRWILSGSICVHLRETRRYGERISQGGDMYEDHQAFIDWARSYDEALPPVRSRTLHQQWMQSLTCSCLTLSSLQPVAQLVDTVISNLQPT